MSKIVIEPTLRISKSSGEELDPMLFRLLQAVHETGKLTRAAEATGYSYRHAWNLIGKWSEFFGAPLVTLERGRGARLTALGEKLAWAVQRLHARLGPQLDNLAAELDEEIHRAAATATSVVRLQASHGYAVAKLPELFKEAGGAVRLQLQYRGSMEALRGLARGECELAGLHVPEGALRRSVRDKFLRLLKPGCRLVELVKRTQGLFVAAGNPMGIAGLPDLARAGVRLVNRQPGSGTRLLFDELLKEAGVAPRRIEGYESHEFTHAAVAAFVASGMADAGFGVEVAARQFKLDFIALARETYFLAARDEFAAQPAFEQLLQGLKSEAFARRVDGLEGYSARDAGRVCTVEQVFGEEGVPAGD